MQFYSRSYLAERSGKSEFGNLDWLLKPDINAKTEEKFPIQSTIPNAYPFSPETFFENPPNLTTPPAAYFCGMETKQHPILPKNAESEYRYNGAQDISPISKLQEECLKRAWPMPKYSLVHESGAPHEKKFQFEVKVNYEIYRPSEMGNKKQVARAIAADYAIKILKL